MDEGTNAHGLELSAEDIAALLTLLGAALLEQ